MQPFQSRNTLIIVEGAMLEMQQHGYPMFMGNRVELLHRLGVAFLAVLLLADAERAGSEKFLDLTVAR